MKTSKRIALVALTVLLVVGAGCLGASGGDGSDGTTNGTTNATDGEYENATAVRQAAADAMADVESYTFTMEMTMETEQATIRSESHGAADVERQRLRQNQSMVMSQQGRNVTLNASTVLVGDTMYISYEGQPWESTNLSEMPGATGSEDMWNQSSTLEQQQRLLNNSEVSFGENRTTTVNGQEAYVVVLDIDEGSLQEVMQGSSTMQQTGTSQVEYRNVTVTQYVATDSMRVVRTEMSLNASTNGQTVHQEMVMTFDSFNEDVTIEPPVEENATAS